MPAALLSHIPADELDELEQTGTASDCLVWASRLYAQFLQDEQPPAGGSASLCERDVDQVPEQTAAFMTGVNLSRGGAGESEAEQAARRRGRTACAPHYVYDEWDYEIEDYRAYWCELREVGVAGDNGAFFRARWPPRPRSARTSNASFSVCGPKCSGRSRVWKTGKMLV